MKKRGVCFVASQIFSFEIFFNFPLFLFFRLPIDISRLSVLAEACHAYAKALYYKEEEFQTHPEACIESLISLNNQLGQPQAAEGTCTQQALDYLSFLCVVRLLTCFVSFFLFL